MNPYPLPARAMATTTVFVITRADGFRAGEREIRFELSDEGAWHEAHDWMLLGPTDQPGATR
jgi:hypothetical protein